MTSPAADRAMTLNVGGTKFVSATSTLMANSTYFASLLSRWSGEAPASDNCGSKGEIFLDQDPASFGILLGYMRTGMIKVGDVDVRVLALAEFLGVEKFLLAAKVRWYRNIGRGSAFSLQDDGKIAAAFDKEHGGLLRAVSTGLFRYFLKPDNVNAEKDFATVSVDHSSSMSMINYVTQECIGGEMITALSCGSLVGALNGIFAKGYVMHEAQLDSISNSISKVTFSRRKHPVDLDGSTGIFIPTDDGAKWQQESEWTKQLVMVDRNQLLEIRFMIVPAELKEDSELGEHAWRTSPHASDVIHNVPEYWLEANNFVTREQRLEMIFHKYFECLAATQDNCMIYSRKIQAA